jgi:hypothetical protein
MGIDMRRRRRFICRVKGVGSTWNFRISLLVGVAALLLAGTVELTVGAIGSQNQQRPTGTNAQHLSSMVPTAPASVCPSTLDEGQTAPSATRPPLPGQPGATVCIAPDALQSPTPLPNGQGSVPGPRQGVNMRDGPRFQP